MPNREFLEKYPLYRKFKLDLPADLAQLDKPAIHMNCPICGSAQTFNMVNEFWELITNVHHPAKGAVVRAAYQCSSCAKFMRYFFLKIGSDDNYLIKIGQEPSFDIGLDPVLERMLGQRASYLRRGLVCESQGYGIGAFAYYRRIVEDIIDNLLADIAELIEDKDREHYLSALEKAKKTTVTQDKIDLVKDLLPPVLRPNGMNPLAVLHSVLSEGLHRESDERCMELAMTVREVLVFLANQVATTKAASATFTDSMRKLLDRKK